MLEEIWRTIWCIARPKRTAPDAQTELAAFANDHAKRLAAWERAGEQLRSERDMAIRAAYRKGLPMVTIARLLEMSHQRVSQIVRS